jgi:hypothetical protein
MYKNQVHISVAIVPAIYKSKIYVPVKSTFNSLQYCIFDLEPEKALINKNINQGLKSSSQPEF